MSYSLHLKLALSQFDQLSYLSVVKNQGSILWKENHNKKTEVFYLMTHTTHFNKSQL